MGSWYLSLTAAFFLILIGLYTHWIVLAAGILLPFVPVVSQLYSRRRAREQRSSSDAE